MIDGHYLYFHPTCRCSDCEYARSRVQPLGERKEGSNLAVKPLFSSSERILHNSRLRFTVDKSVGFEVSHFNGFELGQFLARKISENPNVLAFKVESQRKGKSELAIELGKALTNVRVNGRYNVPDFHPPQTIEVLGMDLMKYLDIKRLI